MTVDNSSWKIALIADLDTILQIETSGIAVLIMQLLMLFIDGMPFVVTSVYLTLQSFIHCTSCNKAKCAHTATEGKNAALLFCTKLYRFCNLCFI